MNTIAKIFGVILLITGMILIFKPSVFGKFSLPDDSYQMIEKRVKWGLVSGLGIFLFYHSNWTGSGSKVTALLAALCLGIIIARTLGLILDGYFLKQLWWLLIEIAAFVFFSFLLKLNR